MERITFEGNFCDITQCESTPGGSYCEKGSCTQRVVWERLKAYEDTGLTPEGVEALKLIVTGNANAGNLECEGLIIDRLADAEALRRAENG